MTSAAMAARAGAAPARCQLARRIYGRSRTPRHVVVGIAAGEGQGMPRPPARAHGIGATQLACAPGGWDSGTGERVPRARTAPYRRRRRDDRGVAYSTTGERANSTGDDGLSARVSDSEDADGDRSSSGRKAASLTAALPAPPGAAGTRSSSAAGSTPPLLGVSTQRAMLAVAGPSICIGLLRTTYGLADQYWVGQLGTGAAVALGGCSYAAWIILVLCELGEMGVQAIAAYDEGAGRRERVARTIVQGCWVSAGVALALVLMMPHADLYFHALGFKPGSGEFAAGVAYLYASIVGALPLAVGAVLTAGMRGVGLLKQALGITTATVLLNILLDPVLIWGLGPFPQLGVAGAAWGTTISTLLGCVLSARVLRREGIRLRWMAPVATLVQRIVNVGSPMCVSGLLFSFVYLFIGRIANDLGAANVAALGLSHRLEVRARWSARALRAARPHKPSGPFHPPPRCVCPSDALRSCTRVFPVRAVGGICRLRGFWNLRGNARGAVARRAQTDQGSQRRQHCGSLLRICYAANGLVGWAVCRATAVALHVRPGHHRVGHEVPADQRGCVHAHGSRSRL